MANEMLLPIWDYVFALLFGDQKNTDILASFLKSVLDLPEDEFEHITIIDPRLKRFGKQDKSGVLDVRLHTRSKKVINIEIQVERSAGMRQRILYYLSKMVWEQIKRGEKYDRLQETISIVICDHVLLSEEKSYQSKYLLRNEESGKAFTELVKIIILELPKAPGTEDMLKVWPWVQFFKCRTGEEFEMLAVKHPEVSKAVAALKELNFIERHRLRAEARAKWRHDWQSLAAERFDEGLEQGKQEGLEQGVINIARNMKKQGYTTEQIAVLTGLGAETIGGL